jgi:alkylation response protein AidB-like acyl-CoA dehydrogenase
MALNHLKEFKVDIKKNPEALPFARFALSSFDLGVNTKVSVHYMLYTNSLLLFGNNPKHLQYYERATSAQDLGCFGLTEFHHGSYTKGIATTANYNHAKK